MPKGSNAFELLTEVGHDGFPTDAKGELVYDPTDFEDETAHQAEPPTEVSAPDNRTHAETAPAARPSGKK